jgi:hypothetical protein
VSTPAAWHPDPSGKHDHRWWDGERWTEHVADAGQASVDPLDAAPPAPGGGAPAPAEGGAAPGGWAQGATEQGRDPDADSSGGGLAGGGLTGGASWEQPGGAAAGTGDQGPAWSSGPTGGPAGQGGSGGAVWDQPGGAAPSGGAYGGPPHGGGGYGDPGQGGGTYGGAPGWQQDQGTSRGSDGVAVAAMIVGILAILVSWVPVLGAIVGIVALVLGVVGRSRIKKSGAGGNGMAVTGIATGAVAIAINIAILAFFVVAGGDFFAEIGSYAECIEETGDEELCQQRLEEGIIQRFGG